jgi:hypothetical protein
MSSNGTALDLTRLTDERTSGDADFTLGDSKPYRLEAALSLLFDDRPSKAGRPSELKGSVVAAIVDALETGATFDEAAIEAGIGVRTFYRWREKGAKSRTLDEYRQFWQLTEYAKRRGKRLLERCAYRGGVTDPKIAIKVLERRHPEEWRLRLEIEDTTDATQTERAREMLAARLDSIEKRLRGVGGPSPLALPESPAARMEREAERDDI